MAVEVAAQRRQHFVGIDADDETQLAARPCPRRNRIDRVIGIARRHCQNLERAPGVDLFGERKPRLAPEGIDDRIAGTGAHLAIGKCTAHRIRNGLRHPFRYADLSTRAHDGRERVDELDRRAGEQPAQLPE